MTATAAVHVGGRLQVVDDDGRIVRLDPAGKHHASRAGFAWKLGDTVARGRPRRGRRRHGGHAGRRADGAADAA